MSSIGTWTTLFRALVDCAAILVFAWELPSRDRIIVPARWRYSDSSPKRFMWRASKVVAILAMSAIVIADKLVGHRFIFDILIVVAVFALYLFWTRRADIRSAIYMAVNVYLCMDLSVATANSIYRHVAIDSLILSILIEVLYAVMLLGLCYLMRRFAPTDENVTVKPLSFCTLLLSLLPYVILRGSDFFYAATGQQGTLMEVLLFLTIIATLGTFAGNYYAILGETEHAHRLQLEMELAERQKRYEVRKEAMAEVNRRYHDIVKYAHTCEKMGHAGSLDEYLEQQMTKDLAVAALQQTGNDIIDALLWENSEICMREGLRLVPNIDARSLSFISDYDLRTIVGNALDNAVEASLQVADAEKREIVLRITQVNQMLFFKVTNYYTGQLHQEMGKLLTTKDDTEAHGYGIENIRRTVERYGGSLLFETEGDRFVLTAMVPIPEGCTA